MRVRFRGAGELEATLGPAPAELAGAGVPPDDAALAIGAPERDPDAPDPRRWTIFAVISVGLFMVSLDQTIVATALPTLHRELHTAVNWAGWSITGYQLGMASAMPVLGRMSDQFGRKRVFMICAAIFITSSLACGLSTSIFMLIPFRVLQALGGGAFLPSATGIISDAFKHERDRPIGLFTSILPFGSLVGPTVGGLIISVWGWRYVFFINVPIGIVLIFLLARIIPRSAPKARQHIDFTGAIQFALVLTGLMIGLSELGDAGTSVLSPQVIGPALGSVVLGVVFVRHLHHTESPVIPIALLSQREFAVMNAMNTTFGVVGLGIGALVPLLAQDRYHLSPLSSGTLLSSRGLAVITLSTIAAYTIRRTGYRIPMVVGFTFIGLGSLLIGTHPLFGSPYEWLAFSAAVVGIGIGFSLPSTNNASLALAPSDIAAAAGLRGTCRQFGAIVGVSIATALAARNTNEGLALSHVFIYFSLLVFPLYFFTFFVKNQKGGW